MVREVLLKELTGLLGKPLGAANQEWWIISRGRNLSLHVVLNLKAPGHLIVLDPYSRGDAITEIQVQSLDEIPSAIDRIKSVITTDETAAITSSAG